MTSTTGNNQAAKRTSARILTSLVPFELLIFIVVVIIQTPGAHYLSADDQARNVTARTQIGAFKTALDLFKVQNGYFPTGTNGLQDLVVKPINATTNWFQTLDKVPLDPWEHPYLYECPGKHNTNSYDLSSAGPDGIIGTKDDIRNWE